MTGKRIIEQLFTDCLQRMNRILHLIIMCALCAMAHAQHVFQGTSLSKALIELDKSTKHYDISFVYDELEDFTVTKTVKRGASLPDAVRHRLRGLSAGGWRRF